MSNLDSTVETEQFEFINVKCACGHLLGRFAPYEDHSAVYAECPSCQTALVIGNGIMGEMLDNPEEWDDPTTLIAGKA